MFPDILAEVTALPEPEVVTLVTPLELLPPLGNVYTVDPTCNLVSVVVPAAAGLATTSDVRARVPDLFGKAAKYSVFAAFFGCDAIAQAVIISFEVYLTVALQIAFCAEHQIVQ